MVGTLTKMALNGVLQWVQGQETDGRITPAERQDIQNHVANAYINRGGSL
jgi:hypothetical protein